MNVVCRYSGLPSARQRTELILLLCNSNTLKLSNAPNRDGATRDDVADCTEAEFFAVVNHFMCSSYFELSAAAIVVDYILAALEDNISMRWPQFFSPLTSDSQFLRGVARTLSCEEALHHLHLTGALQRYLRFVEVAASIDGEGLLQAFAIEGDVVTDFTALHAVILIPGRLAQAFPEAPLSLTTPVVHLTQRILSCLLSQDRISNFLLRFAIPSPIRVMIENLHLSPRNAKGLRLVILQSTVRCLVGRASKSWVEHFSLCGGPYQTVFTLTEWCAEAAIGGETSLSDERNAVLYDILCMLLALSDDGNTFDEQWYLWLSSGWGDARIRDSDEALMMPSGGKNVLGAFGFRALVQCCMSSMTQRPNLHFHLSRLLLIVVKHHRRSIVREGLVSAELCEIVRRNYICPNEIVTAAYGGDLDHHNEYHFFVTAITELFCACCSQDVLIARQEGGAEELTQLVVSLLTHPSPLVTCSAIKTLLFLAAEMRPSLLSYRLLVRHDLFGAVTSELLQSNGSTRKMYLLQLVKEICSECPPLQQSLIQFAANIIQLMSDAARSGDHELLPLCSDIISGLSIVVYDKAMTVCQSLAGLVARLEAQASNACLIAACWGLQTIVKMIAKETCVKMFFKEHREQLLNVLDVLCPKLTELRVAFNEDVCNEYNTYWTQRRHHYATHSSDDRQRYFLCCDVLLLTLHAINLTQCLLPGSYVDELTPFLFQHLSKGPVLQCRLYTSIVSRSLIGMACFANLSVLKEMHHQTKVSMVPVTTATKQLRVSLQDLTSGWTIPSSVGDNLFACHQQRIVRPQFIRALLELVRSSKHNCDHFALELVVSMIELMYHSFHQRVENLYTLSMCGVWDVAVGQLTKIAAETPALRSLCVQVVASSLRMFGLFGVSTVAMNGQLLLCVNNDKSTSEGKIDEADLVRTMIPWEYLLNNCLPCRVPQQFLSVGVGCETVMKQRALSNIPTAANKRELQLQGGIDLAVNYDVFRYPTDTHVSVVQWVMIDISPSHDGNTVLMSLHFDKNRVSIELGADESNVLYVAVNVKGNGEVKTKRVALSKLPTLPHKQWSMIFMTIENFAQKGQNTLRSKLAIKISVGIKALHGNQLSFEAAVNCPEMDFPQGIRDRGFSTCTSLTHIGVGSMRQRQEAVSQEAERVPHQLFLGSMGVFFGELSLFDSQVLFALGSDALTSLDFMEKTNIVDLYPLLAKLYCGDGGKKSSNAELAFLASLWMKRADCLADSTAVTFSGAFPFTKCNRERVVCLIGVNQGDLCVWTRTEALTISAAIAEATAPSPPSNSSLASPLTESFARPSAAFHERQASGVGAVPPPTPQSASNQLREVSNDFVSHPKAKPLVLVPLQLCMDDVMDDKPSHQCVVEKPLMFSIVPFYAVLESLGGLHTLLWFTSLLEECGEGQVAMMRCISTYLGLHVREQLTDAFSGEGSRRQELPLLTTLLHTRIGLNENIAGCITQCSGSPLVARIDLLPLLLDFSLWSRDEKAMQVVTTYLAQLQMPPNPFASFNSQLLSWEGTLTPAVDSKGGGHRLLDELLLHIHMRFSGNTSGEWGPSTIPCVRTLLTVLCIDEHAATKIVASAAWLTADESDMLSHQWALCLLDAVLSSFGDRLLEKFPESLANNVVSILKSNNEDIRLRALRLLMYLPMTAPTLSGVVAQYEARSIVASNLRCITNAELRLLMTKVVGNEGSVLIDTLSLCPSAFAQEEMLSSIGKPLLFVLITLVPSLTDDQQCAVVRFISDVLANDPATQLALTDRSLLSPSLDAPFSSYVLFSIAETFERSERSLDVGRGSTISSLVELLIDICALKIAQLSGNRFISAIDTVTTVLYTIFNVFVEGDEIGSRRATPFFHCAKSHMLNVCSACLYAFDSRIDVASSPLYLECAWQMMDLVNDVTVLLYIPSRHASHDDLTTDEASSGSPAPSQAPSLTASFGSDSPKCGFQNRRGNSSTSKSLKVRPILCSLLGVPETQCQHVSRDNIDLVPIYALQCSSKLHSKIQSGATAASSSMDKHATAKLCSQLHQQQLKLLAYILTIPSPFDDAQLEELQLLAMVHAYYIGASVFGLEVKATTEKKKGTKATAAPSATFSGLVKAPSSAKWTESLIVSPPDSLLMSTAVRYKEPTLALLKCSLKVMTVNCQQAAFAVSVNSAVVGEEFVDRERAQGSQPAPVGKASLCQNICRVLLYHNKGFPIRRELADSLVFELETICNAYMTVSSMIASEGRQAYLRLSKLPEGMLAASGVMSLQRYTVGLVNHAISRALQNLRVPSSFIAALEPLRAVQAREYLDPNAQKFQSTVLKRASLYTRTLEEDGHALLAVHAAYRFALLPWWGALAALYTEKPVSLNRWELDRFMGPEWERCRLRRFVREPKMLSGDSSATKFFDGLTSVLLHDFDDVSLLGAFGISACPQSINNKLLQADATTYRCRLILPMDRVPIQLYVSPTAVSIRVDLVLSRRAGSSSVIADMATDDKSKRKRRSGTLTSRGQQSLASSKYHHEIPAQFRIVPMSSVRAVWPRRNLLQQVALELLLDSGDSLFIAFEAENERKAVMELIGANAKPFLDKTLLLNESNLKIWRSWWCDGRVSNFKYLMYLNFCGGRSYGDMRQYPVFPHIVADYSAPALDLTKPGTFRVLERPMGAQSQEREEKVIKKYDEIASLGFTDTESSAEYVDFDLMPLHYGSHYSPPGGALHFLVRVQPFGDYFLDMNSKLDDADRVFESMLTAYTISSTGKDVKELVPEFFCLPEMYVNSNNVPFGTKQDGSVVHNVQLPRWAPTPREFTVQLRDALESRFVSERLHKWIDLIFGYKQRGKDAIAAVNVFHPLTYEGTVDLTKIDDTVRRKSHETQIDSFGQTPVQLFPKAPHKARVKAGSSDPFYSIPCPTIRYDNAFAKNSALLFPERLAPTLVSSAARSEVGSFITFCRSPSQNAAMGADEVGDWILSSSSVSKSMYHVLPTSVIPFTIVADTPKDFVVVKAHSVAFVDAKDLGKDLASATVTKGQTTVAAATPPFVFVGTTCGAITVVEVQTTSEALDIEVPPQQQPGKLSSTDMVLATFNDAKFQRLKVPSVRVLDSLHGHQGAVVALTIASEWGIMVSAAQDNIIAVWDISRRLLVRTIPFANMTLRGSPSGLLHECLHDGLSFYPQHISVNPKRGDIVVAGLERDGDTLSAEVRLFSINGERCAVNSAWKVQPTAVLAMGPVVFVAEGKSLVVLDSISLERRAELQHPSLEDTIVSIAVNAYGTCVAAIDKSGVAASWKI